MPFKDVDAEKLCEITMRAIGLTPWRQGGSAGQKEVEREDGTTFWTQRDRDLWNCIDIIAKNDTGGLSETCHPIRTFCGKPKPFFWLVQVTTKGGVNARQKKVEKELWSRALVDRGILRVSIWHHHSLPTPADHRKYLHFWVIRDYVPNGNAWEWQSGGTFSIGTTSEVRKKQLVIVENAA